MEWSSHVQAGPSSYHATNIAIRHIVTFDQTQTHHLNETIAPTTNDIPPIELQACNTVIVRAQPMNGFQRRNIIYDDTPIRTPRDKSIAQELDLPNERSVPLEESNAVPVDNKGSDLNFRRRSGELTPWTQTRFGRASLDYLWPPVRRQKQPNKPRGNGHGTRAGILRNRRPITSPRVSATAHFWFKGFAHSTCAVVASTGDQVPRDF